jgi:hypothetical protein
MRFRWTDGELYGYLEDARKDIGNTPPSPMDLTYPMAYAEVHTLLLTGGFIFALESRGTQEMFNKFQYQDELSLNFDRTLFFQNPQSLKAAYEQEKMRWRRDKAFHDTKAIGLASGRFPLYASRIIGLSLANSQSMFSV